jgi:hypothetical protein
MPSSVGFDPVPLVRSLVSTYGLVCALMILGLEENPATAALR